MLPDKIQHVYFLGIGGIGMSALARYFKACGAQISGYDRVRSPLCIQLEKEGMNIHYTDQPEGLDFPYDLLIYTPAIPQDLGEWKRAKKMATPLLKRAEILGELSRKQDTIAVAGTHGKTTTSTLIAYLLAQSSIGCQAFLGGISKNYQSNLILNPQASWMVAEADEYDRSFLKLSPKICSVSSIDADHLDIYGTAECMRQAFVEFLELCDPQGFCLVKHGLALPKTPTTWTYHRNDPQADCFADQLRVVDGAYHFDLQTPLGRWSDLSMTYPGLHNIENAVLALAIVQRIGIREDEARRALPKFEGVSRRFDVRLRQADCLFIDDYAHHPNELAACIQSIRHLFPEKRVTAVFQPHLFTRTRDLADEFANVLSSVDHLILLPIYPARELPIEGVSSENLLAKCHAPQQEICQDRNLVERLKELKPELILTLGAGDIDRLVEPIENAFRHDA